MRESLDISDNRKSAMKRITWPLLLGGAVMLILQVVIILLVAEVIPTAKEHGRSETNEEEMEGSEFDPLEHIKPFVRKTFYGKTADQQDVYKYTLANTHSMELEVISFGGTIIAIKVPDKEGVIRDVALGYDNKQEYFTDSSTFFGTLVGRVANRIARGSFTLDGTTYQLNTNNGENHLHGGSKGWNKAVWDSRIEGDRLELTLISPDGDMGYPGDVKARVTYQLTENNEIFINFTAHAYRKATPINLTSHPYFNLAGEGNDTIYDHIVMINADDYISTDEELIPTGVIEEVNGTTLDLRTPTELGAVIHDVMGGGKPGFDHCFCIKGPTGRRLAARISHPGTGIGMEVFTNQPGMQFYTGNFLDAVSGKRGHVYTQHTGFCMETQNYPDAINHENFPDSVLHPGPSSYEHHVWYKFYTTRK